MPPRVREVVALLKARGFVFERWGKGDHGLYRNPETGEAVVGRRQPGPRIADACLAKVAEAFWMEEWMKTVSVRIVYDPNTKTYGATSEDLPDVYAVGGDRDDALARFVRSANTYVDFLRKRSLPLPAALETNAELVTVTIDAA